MSASGTPTPQSTKLAINVPRAYCAFGRISATIPPEAAATTHATMGSSHAAPIVSSVMLVCRVILSTQSVSDV